MIKLLQKFVTLILLFASTAALSQVSSETFPNTYNVNAGADGSFTGSIGQWTTVSSPAFTVEVIGDVSVSTPNALRFQVNSTLASATIGENIATSPTVNLSFGACQPSSASFSFQLYTDETTNNNNNFTFGVQFLNGATWTTVWSKTSNQLDDDYNENDWNLITVNLPSTYWNAGFRYRFYSIKNTTSGTSNETELWVDDAQISVVTTGPAFPSFADATPDKIVDIAGSGIQVGDTYKFDNVVTSPENIYAEVRVEALVNATITNIDDNSTGVAQRFQPLIAPNPPTTTGDQEGYAQFSITFKKASNNALVLLDGLRYRHYDVDGTTGTNYTFRETGWITGQAAILVNPESDLSDGGTVSSGGYSWKKILGELEEHTGITSDVDVYFTATYGSLSTIRFRLGYIFDKVNASPAVSVNNTPREYGTEFGCFSIAQNIPLPIVLSNFNGTYANNRSLLNWVTESEINFDRFEIERSTVGGSFAKIGTVPSKERHGRNSYQLQDDLSGVAGSTFYYRLKSIDKDGKYTYSKVLIIRKDSKLENKISLVPNPSASGNATINITSLSSGSAELQVIDNAGRMIKAQRLNLYEGVNVVPINNLRLTPGVYSAVLSKEGERFNTRFVITQ